MFLLENVDMEDDQDGNLGLIVRSLEDAGYTSQVYKCVSTDFALPQRRVRLYILGFNKTRQPQIVFENISQRIELFRLKTLPVEP